MRVLVCGASGFIGRAIAEALRARGHEVVRGVRRADELDTCAIDFARDVVPGTWRPRVRGLDAVVNAVGALRDAPGRPLAALHHQTPAALFDACAEEGVRTVVQVSALGVDRSETAYARTKRAADEHLAALARASRVDATVLRPSIVFGAGGASTALFLRLASLPVALLPRPVRTARIQPVAVHELAEFAVRCVESPPSPHDARPIACVGPSPLRLGEFIASLRAQSGRGPALVATLPDVLTTLSARLGDLVPASPWCSDAVSLLGVDNVADPAQFASLLGRPATAPERLLAAEAVSR